VTVHADAPPVGLRDVTTFPTWSTAAQKLLLGHEMAVTTLEPSTRVTVHTDGPPVGSVDVITSPAAPTATQRALVGQETPTKHGDHPLIAAPQSAPRTCVTTHAVGVALARIEARA